MNPRFLSIIFIAIGFSILGIVWILQYQFGFIPCPLCYYQRYAWWLLIFLGLVGFIYYRTGNSYYQKKGSWLIITAMFIMLFSMGLAGYHAGIEWNWWQGPTTCSLIDLTDPIAGGVDDFFSAGNIVSCDTPALIFLGLSLSGWNFVASLILFILLFVLLNPLNRPRYPKNPQEP